MVGRRTVSARMAEPYDDDAPAPVIRNKENYLSRFVLRPQPEEAGPDGSVPEQGNRKG